MIEVENLSKRYGYTTAISDITFNVERGEILGFLGPNGAGKTTTMRILAGYLPATSGTVRIAGYNIQKDSLLVRRQVGYLPETPPLYPEMTVEGFLYFVARIKGVSPGDRADKVKSAIIRCNLQDNCYTIIRKLSKGYRQRVGIAQAIIHDPPAIILDEPTVGLDPRQIIEVRNLIRNLAGSHTILLSTHILSEVSMTCSRVVIINRGKVVATNSPEKLMADIASNYNYKLEVSGEVNLVRELLQNIPGVVSVEVIPTNEKSDQNNNRTNRTNLLVISKPGTELGESISTLLIQHGFGLHQMQRVSATLEDVFLQLTTADKNLQSNTMTSIIHKEILA
ncbi:ABC-type multidrug transport system, ATPase component [Richelia intracellularis HM01]|uniref:ABC transporter ATP-binding protein n=1 Tax=Richelia intracellularis TaxID=1164990 RepID=UPI0002B58C01|nr:ABC transporter ATP-binding protein [Richelia intracellularis]CCH64834.1 ABC-type multidrug transport system, ATPase component [Richelia intracellularis HM01]